MQEREPATYARTPLEQLLARHDEAALEYVTDALLHGRELEPDAVPAAEAHDTEDDVISAG